MIDKLLDLKSLTKSDLVSISDVWGYKKAHRSYSPSDYVKENGSYYFLLVDDEIEGLQILEDGTYDKFKRPFIIIKGKVSLVDGKYVDTYLAKIVIGDKTYSDIKFKTRRFIDPIVDEYLIRRNISIDRRDLKFDLSRNFLKYLDANKVNFKNNTRSGTKNKVNIIRPCDSWNLNEKINKDNVIALYKYNIGGKTFDKIELTEKYVTAKQGDVILRIGGNVILESVKEDGFGQLHFFYNEKSTYKKEIYEILLDAVITHKEYLKKSTFFDEVRKTGDNISTCLTFIDGYKSVVVENKVLGELVIGVGNMHKHITPKHPELTMKILMRLLDNIKGVYKRAKGSQDRYVESIYRGEYYRVIINKNNIITAYKISDDMVRNGIYKFCRYYKEDEFDRVNRTERIPVSKRSIKWKTLKTATNYKEFSSADIKQA